MTVSSHSTPTSLYMSSERTSALQKEEFNIRIPKNSPISALTFPRTQSRLSLFSFLPLATFIS